MRIRASGHQEPEMLDCAWLCLPNGIPWRVARAIENQVTLKQRLDL